MIDCDLLLPTAEFTINSCTHSAHSHSPFEVLYGYTPDFTIPVGAVTKYPTIEQRLEALRDAQEDAEAALRMSKEHMRVGTTGKTQDFTVGQPVWLSVNNLKI